ncbi:MAG: nuclear transport factor 2 family protein [Acidobacteria bacterium]|nr:nuclear transport factor 2 family protein [Acidobacteriota bacterium]
MNDSLAKWHQFIETQAPGILGVLLDDEVKFHSPFVWKPKEGKLITTAILSTAAAVFEEFEYVREILDGNHWALEFEAKIGELKLRGVDLIELNDEGRIIDFEVMIRPANGLQALGMEMTKRLSAKGLI